MYGLTRGTITLLGAAGAGVLVWLATQVDDGSNGGYWAVYGLIAAAGVVIAHQPDANWFRSHVLGWSDDIGILGLVRDLTEYVAVLAFGVGLVFGFTFDTSGPATYGPFGRRRRAAAIPAGGAAPPPEDRPTAREEREAETVREDDARRDREPARTE
jgi:hypothetical protein